jgi:hypothetical protein
MALSAQKIEVHESPEFSLVLARLYAMYMHLKARPIIYKVMVCSQMIG